MATWERNFRNKEGRSLRLTSTFIGWSDKSVHTIETAIYDVVRNLERGIRNETMYEVSGRVLEEAKKILRESKEDSLTFTADNTRSHHLESRLKITHKEADILEISPPDDIPYAGITDMVEYEIEGDMRFYWFRYGFSRRAERVLRPGNQYLTLAKKRKANNKSVVDEFNRQVRFAQAHGVNVNADGASLRGGGSMARNRAKGRRA